MKLTSDLERREHLHPPVCNMDIDMDLDIDIDTDIDMDLDIAIFRSTVPLRDIDVIVHPSYGPKYSLHQHS